MEYDLDSDESHHGSEINIDEGIAALLDLVDSDEDDANHTTQPSHGASDHDDRSRDIECDWNQKRTMNDPPGDM